MGIQHYVPVRNQTWFSTTAGVNLRTLLGDDAFVCSITIGNGTGDAIVLSQSSDDTPVFYPTSGGTRTTFLRWPISTVLVDNRNGTIADLMADVTIGTNGEVSLGYFVKS